MKLHRTSGKPEWESIRPANYTRFQKVAAQTAGIITPANIITILGLSGVIFGLNLLLHHHYWLGLSVLIIGRLLDILDGVVAEATQTKSPVGEMFDATADKIATLLAIILLPFADITAWWIMALLILPQVLIFLVVLYKRKLGIAIHPSRQGKLSMALLWLAVGGFIIVKALDGSTSLAIVAYLTTGLSVMLGLYALWQYATGKD